MPSSVEGPVAVVEVFVPLSIRDFFLVDSLPSVSCFRFFGGFKESEVLGMFVEVAFLFDSRTDIIENLVKPKSQERVEELR